MSKLCVQATWNDVPHLTPEVKAQLLEGIEPHLRDARSKGIPMMGAGIIYPVPESTIICDPFEIPSFWPKAFGLDVGWNKTACIWGAWDRQTDTVYLWSEHYVGEAVPSVHAAAIKSRGEWIPGVIDPAASGRSQKDGEQLIVEYRALGLNLTPANNAVEAGIHAMYQRMAQGGLKVFSTCRNWFSESRIYRRDEKGKIVKTNDHLMDASRYLIMSGMIRAITEPVDVNEADSYGDIESRSAVTGY